ncbi:DUF2971 domain-containing protein [Brevundimonas sp. S30B]|uniref:DUF2971 domain-containing protein n=1 Tax=unclassified Brevundimonas TaxID=2622653 RepID=UPI00107229A1|nr:MULTISPECIES: DUF2971 domain-containing protein [unclassified Brevundimonas]QBX37849.1 DUF2971 domain-containing protein [Brevundimonas sp. MF30-B]TFW02795.1 DUF2971 domain-containing protein [Brevundimonas sp. S30B]
MSFEDWTSGELERLALDVSLKRPSPHQSIFKYVGLNGKKSWDLLERTLNACELVGSTYNALNDPYELSPHLFNDLRPVTIARALGERAPLAARLKGEPWDPNVLFADVARYEAEARELFAKIQQGARIIAFCDRSDSPLLWSHYANSYEGACLHFTGGAFERRLSNFGYVSYSTHRPTYPLSLALELSARKRTGYSDDNLRQAESDKLVFYTKAADWAYEREVRIVYTAPRQTSLPFQPDGLLSVILGPRMSSDNEARLRDLLARSRVPHLPVRKASLSTNSFSVEID